MSAPVVFEVYADRAGKYRWRARAANGRRVAASGESFASKSNAERAVRDFQDAVLAIVATELAAPIEGTPV